MINKTAKILLFIFISFFVFNVQTLSTSGDSTTGGITIWPTLHVIDIKCGEKSEIKTYVQNNTEEETIVEVKYKNLKYSENVQGEEYLDESLYPASWLKSISPSLFTLEKGETKEFITEIAPPQDAQIKGYYPVIVFRFFSDSSAQNGLTASGQIASIVYLSLTDQSGKNPRKEITLRSFEVQPTFSLNPYTTFKFSLELENTGDIHLRPRGFIEIFDPAGTRQSNSPKINDTLIYLLPNQKFSENLNWKDNTITPLFPPIGKYRAVLHITTVEDRNLNLEKEVEFFVLPPHYIIAAGLIIVCLFLIVYFGIKLAKKLKINVKIRRRR
jgi:hypothetical protein